MIAIRSLALLQHFWICCFQVSLASKVTPRYEKADKLAKDGAQKGQKQNPITLSEVNSIIKSHSRNTWMLQHPGYYPPDNYHKLGRREPVIIFPLRTGHSRLALHMH